MIRSIFQSEKGLTLVECLVSLVIYCLITVLIIGYLVSSLNNFKRVNEEIELHDEANYVMSQFVNYIFVATKIEVVSQTETKSLVKVTDFNNQVTTLGFENNKAVINGNVIHPETYTFQSSGSNASKITINGDTVKIQLVINDEQSRFRKNLELDSEVSYVNVK